MLFSKNVSKPNFCGTIFMFLQLHVKSGSGPWTRTLKNLELKNMDPEKPGPSKLWTLKNMDPEKHGINMGSKSMSDFRKSCFENIMHNVICCLKFTDIDI